MATNKYEDAMQLLAGGMSASAVGRQLGIPESTIRGWRGGKKPQIPAAAQQQPVATDRVASLEMELSALRAQANRPAITSQYQPPPQSDERNLWLKEEAENAERIKRALERGLFTLDLSRETKPVAFTFISDQHISFGNLVDMRRMREDAELIAETDGCYALLGGDAVDNHIKHRAAILAARSQPGDQYKAFNWYLQIFAPRIACMVTGNHDYWTAQFAGIDMIDLLAQQNRIAYSPFEAYVNCKFSGHDFLIGLRHKYRLNSSFNQGHAPKQWHRNGERMCDLYCIGDHHDPHVEITRLHGLERGVCRPGSYQITSAYAGMEGWNSTIPTCPTWLVWPNERRFVGFHDMRTGLEVLKMYRGGK